MLRLLESSDLASLNIERIERRVKLSKYVVLGGTAIGIAIVLITGNISVYVQDNNLVYKSHQKLMQQCFALTMLTVFILMGIQNVTLFQLLKKLEKRSDTETAQFSSEKRNLMIIFVFFEISFFFKFLYYELLEYMYRETSLYTVFMIYNCTVILGGLSFLSMFVIHLRSFPGKESNNARGSFKEI